MTTQGLPEFNTLINSAGYEAAEPDETPDETVFRLIIESEFFDSLNIEEREDFLLMIAHNCIAWRLNREQF